MHRVYGLYENQTVGFDVLDEDQQEFQRGFDDQPKSGGQQRVQPLDGGIVFDHAVHTVHVQHHLTERYGNVIR